MPDRRFLLLRPRAGLPSQFDACLLYTSDHAFGFGEAFGGHGLDFAGFDDATAEEAVSYTHLDVYKRQLSTVLKTADGNNMVVSYGTAEADSRDEDGGYNGGDMAHTGTQLRIAASGPGAQRVIGLTDQTDNFYTCLLYTSRCV